ncbi:uncharacterized protein [Panulirus ornatus]|uniref:uncharacterized protein isoform X3 n=1 Tax=Panulirus ornatus TaxID=150431 RepID=UPI003A8801CA
MLFRVAVSLLLWLCSTSWAKDEGAVREVYVAQGQTARLSCALTKTTHDPVVLVLWYKNGTKTPVFSVDARGYDHREWDDLTDDVSWATPRAGGVSWGGTREGEVSWVNAGTTDASWASTRAGDVFKGRASLEEERGRWTLLVHKAQFQDQGQYRCRLDFKSSPTHNAKVVLHVVDVPRQLRIFTPGGTLVEGVASAQEGQPLTLSCRATAGKPLVNVTWWSGATLLDAHAEEWLTTPPDTSPMATPPTSYVTNTLHVPALTRAHLSQTLTCRASNTPTLAPLTASLHLQETKSQLTVHLGSPPGHMAGGHNYTMKCEASGVRPPPVLTWWLRGKRVTQGVATQRSLGSGSTVSELRVLATPAQDGALLQCRAMAPTLPHLTASASTRITVHYVPEASINLQRSRGVGGGLRAGDSATLTCATRSNPPTNNITFMFNGRPLHRGQVVWNGPSSLTLLHLHYRDVGLYTCLASNTVGDGQSNAVALNIHYAPVCEWEGTQEVLATVGEKVKLVCQVQAAPPQVTFTWEGLTFTPDMGKEQSAPSHEDSGLRSVAWLVADNVSSSEGQQVKCQASNSVGPADQPCYFTIVFVDEPSPLIGCHYHDVTTDSAEVTCSPGITTGHLPQTYHIQVLEGEVLVASFNRSEPKFSVTSLSPGRGYLLVMYTSHARGRGPPTTLLLKTHTPKAQHVASESLSVNLEVQKEEPPSPVEESAPATPLSVVMAGVVVGVVMAVAVVVAVTVTCRAHHQHHQAHMPSETHYHHTTSQDSLMEVPVTALYRSCSRHPSCELLTTFSPGPIVVTQVTPRRSFSRSSLPRRRASTLSTPGSRSPRPVRPRAFSCRGGAVHVLQVDAANPRAALSSPSRWTTLRGLRGGALRLEQDSDSSTFSLRREPFQQGSGLQTTPKFQSTPHVHLSPQCFLSSQDRCPSQPHMSPQGYDIRGLPQVRRRSQSQSLSHSYDRSPRVRRPSLSHSSTPSYDMADLLLRLRRSSTQRYDLTRLPQGRGASQSPRSYDVRNLPKIRCLSQPHSSPQRYNITDLPLSHPQDQVANLPEGIPGIQVTPVAHSATLPHTTPQPLTTTPSPTMGFPHTDSQFNSPTWLRSPLHPSSSGCVSPSPHLSTTPQIKTHISPPDTLSRLASQVHSTIQGHHQLEPHTITAIPCPQTPDRDLSSDNPPEIHPSTNIQQEGTHYTSHERSSIKLYPTFRSFEF